MELDGPGDSERDLDTGDKRLDVPEPPDVATAHESITALVGEQGRLQQRKVWEPRPLHRQLKPRHQGAEFDKSQPSSTGPPAALGGTWILMAPDPAACLQAELARRLRQSQQHARRLEEAPRCRSSSEEPLALLHNPHQPELETAETRPHTPLEGGLQHPWATATQRFHRHRVLCARIIHQQRQLITGASLP